MKNSFKTSLKFLKYFSWNSIFFEYLKKSAIIFFIPILLTFSVCLFYYNSLYKTQTMAEHKTSFYKTSFIIDQLFNTAQNTYNKYIQSDFISLVLLLKEVDGDFYNSTISELKTSLHEITSSSQYFEAVYFFNSSNNYVYSSGNGNYLDNFEDTYWYKIIDESSKKNNNVYFLNNEESNKLYICYPVIKPGAKYGLLVFKVDLMELNTILNKSQAMDEDIFISDSNGRIIYSSVKELIGTNDEVAQYLFKTLTATDISTEKYKKNVYYTNYTHNERLMLTSKFSTSIKLSPVSAGLFSMLFLFVVLTISLLLAFFPSLQYYNSVVEILVKLQGNDIASGGNNELLYIQDNLMRAITDRKNFETEVSEKISQLKETELNALQMQFNPHFLFNTLNSISLMAMNETKSDNNISKTISHLSSLLSASLNLRIKYISIKDEIAYIEKYIEIERIRFMSDFEVRYDIDEDVLDCSILKLITQPILENAFQYGLYGKEKKGLLIISIKQDSRNIVVKITDNGTAIDSKKLTELKNQLKTHKLPSSHIGLCNTNLRIKLTYGEKYGCFLTSDQNGTAVKIVYPKSKIS